MKLQTLLNQLIPNCTTSHGITYLCKKMSVFIDQSNLIVLHHSSLIQRCCTHCFWFVCHAWSWLEPADWNNTSFLYSMTSIHDVSIFLCMFMTRWRYNWWPIRNKEKDQPPRSEVCANFVCTHTASSREFYLGYRRILYTLLIRTSPFSGKRC